MERYTPEEAMAEADVLEGKIASGEAVDYQEAHELIDDKTEAAESTSLERLEHYLENTVFRELGLTEEDRAKKLDELVREGKSAEEVAIHSRSFENIRETLKIFYKKMTVEGVTDTKGARESFELKREKAQRQRFEELTATENFSEFENLIQLEGGIINVVETEFIRLLKEIEKAAPMHSLEPVDEEKVGALTKKINRIMELKDKLIGPQAFDENSEYSEALNPNTNVGEEFIFRTNPEELTALLTEEVKRIKENYGIYYNCSVDTLKRIIEKGKAVGITSLAGGELKDAITLKRESAGWKDQFSGTGEIVPYIENRKAIEKALGYEGKDIVYGVTELGEVEGHTTYGGVSIKINPEAFPLICFSEGDSLPITGTTGISAEKTKKKSEEKTEEQMVRSAMERQLIFEHAVISKALQNLIIASEVSFGGEEVTTGVHTYLEAHILGGIPFDSEHIEEIKVTEDLDYREYTEALKILRGTKLGDKVVQAA